MWVVNLVCREDLRVQPEREVGWFIKWSCEDFVETYKTTVGNGVGISFPSALLNIVGFTMSLSSL